MIDYGARARIGLMVPSGNAICEAELHAMLPPGVVALITRLELRGSSEAELSKMLDRLEEAAGLLADARPGLIGFHCTAVSTFAPERAGEIPARMTRATGLPAVTTADAILAALEALAGPQVMGLITHQADPSVAGIVSAWPSRFENTRALRLGLSADASFTGVLKQYIHDNPEAVRQPQARQRLGLPEPH